MTDISRQRASLYMETSDDPDADSALFDRWLNKWSPTALLVKTTESSWDVEAPLVALLDLPRRMFMTSEWATYPLAQTGAMHASWTEHFDDGRGLPGFGGRSPNTSLERTRDK